MRKAERDVVPTNAACGRANGPPPSGAWGMIGATLPQGSPSARPGLRSHACFAGFVWARPNSRC